MKDEEIIKSLRMSAKSNYFNGQIRSNGKLVLVYEMIEKFTSKKDAIKSLIKNEYGIAGNVYYENKENISDKAIEVAKELDFKTLSDASSISRNIVVENQIQNNRVYMSMWLKIRKGMCLYAIGQELRKDDDFILDEIIDYPEIITISKHVGTERKCCHIDFFKKALSLNGSCYSYIRNLPIVKGNKELAKIALKTDGLQILHMSPNYQNDIELGLLAVKQNGGALEWLGTNCKDNYEIVKTAVKNKGLALEFASSRLKDTDEIVELAITQDAHSIRSASDRIKDDEEIMKKVVSENGYMLKFASNRLKSNKELVVLALTNTRGAIEFADKKFLKDSDILPYVGKGVLKWQT